MNTDYTIRGAQRNDAGLVTYTFVDRYGNVRHLTVAFEHSVPEIADRLIRRMIEQTPIRRVGA